MAAVRSLFSAREYTMQTVKNLAVPALLVLWLAIAASWQAGTAQDAKATKTQQWEYDIAMNPERGYLIEAGLSGWELVTVVHHDVHQKTFYFKRPK
jgi:hypothetical protein